MLAEENYGRVETLLTAEGRRRGLKHSMGVTSFKAVYDALLPSQKVTLSFISAASFEDLMKNGSVISIAYAYKPYAIEAIAHGSEGYWDKERWNVYARAYARLNEALNYTSVAVANEIDGTAVPATINSYIEADTVEEYYASRVSHRVVAELSGVGWRGRSELVVSPLYGPAIRLASVLTSKPIRRTQPLTQTCGDCQACIDACSILQQKEKLANYREQCRGYLAYLALEDEVCGKCIKACIKDGLYASQFKL